MTTLTIQLTDDAAERLRKKASAAGRTSVEELVGDLIEREALRVDDADSMEQGRIDRFHELIEEGCNSPRMPFDRTYMDRMRARLREEFDEDGTAIAPPTGVSRG
ncbi:MAG: hypothetical protein AAF916_08890 [Planctomycetota bacterium]